MSDLANRQDEVKTEINHGLPAVDDPIAGQKAFEGCVELAGCIMQDPVFKAHELAQLKALENKLQVVDNLVEKYQDSSLQNLSPDDAKKLQNAAKTAADAAGRTEEYINEACEVNNATGIYKEVISNALMQTSPATKKLNERSYEHEQNGEPAPEQEPEQSPKTDKETNQQKPGEQILGQLSSPLKQLSGGQGNYLG